MNATCSPFSMATTAASSATIVLPAPTSPCSRRFIGCGRWRSSTTLLERSRCPIVSLNGSTCRADSRMRSSTTIWPAFGSARAARRRAITPIWKRNASSKINRRCGAVAKRFSSSRFASAGGKWVAWSAAYRVGKPCRRRNSSGTGSGRSGSQPQQRVVHEPPLDLRRDRAGFFVHGNNASGMDRLAPSSSSRIS